MDYEVAGALHPAIQGLFLSVILLCLGSTLFFKFIPMTLQKQQRVVVSHFMLFFLSIFCSYIVASLSGVIGYEIASALTGVMYLLGYYSLRQGLIIRKTGVVAYAHKNPWIVAHLIVYSIFLMLLLDQTSKDEYKRIFFLTTNLMALTLLTLPQVVRDKLKPTKGEQLAKSALWVMLILMCVSLVALAVTDDFQSYLVVAVPIQALNIHIVVLSLCALLLSDSIHIHYDNSMTDALTGVSNRRRFEQDVKASLEQLKQHPEGRHTAAMLVADLDHFKKVNDRYGHDVGDKAIVAFANMLKDSVPEYAHLARLGGEEFVVFLPQVGKDESQSLAEQLRLATHHITIPVDHSTPLKITASFGIVVFDVTDKTLSDFFRAADRAMYNAKDLGRDSICNYHLT